MQNMDWYHSLNQPLLSPPDWIFAPVWIFLYITILISLILFLRTGDLKNKLTPLTFWGLQLFFNLLWSPTFFINKNIKLALIICGLLVYFIYKTIKCFYKYSKLSAYLLIPYLFWGLFAFYLNFEIWRLN